MLKYGLKVPIQWHFSPFFGCFKPSPALIEYFFHYQNHWELFFDCWDLKKLSFSNFEIFHIFHVSCDRFFVYGLKVVNQGYQKCSEWPNMTILGWFFTTRHYLNKFFFSEVYIFFWNFKPQTVLTYTRHWNRLRYV